MRIGFDLYYDETPLFIEIGTYLNSIYGMEVSGVTLGKRWSRELKGNNCFKIKNALDNIDKTWQSNSDIDAKLTDYEKKYGNKPDLNDNEQVLKLKELAQEQLEQLRERVFKENVSEEKLAEMTFEDIQSWKDNIRETFGPDYKFEEMENILGNKIAAIQSVSSIISSIETQEALKLLFRANGRNIGAPMDPPYVNYNGVYAIFEALEITRREDCLACGDIEGEENVQIVVPFDADVKYIFKAMEISEYVLDPELWMITNPTNKEIVWDPLTLRFKDPDYKLKALKIKSNDIISITPIGRAKEESEIKKYNVVITYM